MPALHPTKKKCQRCLMKNLLVAVWVDIHQLMKKIRERYTSRKIREVDWFFPWRSKTLFSCKIQDYKTHIERESYIHVVLNLDKIKNKLHSLLLNCETNLISLIRLWLDNKLVQYTCANNELISFNKFIL